jgi:hypothetical protein
MKTPTISEIVAKYREMNPEGHFFDRDTLKFFGQKLSDFEVIQTVTEPGNIFRLNYTNWYDSVATKKTVLFNYDTGKMGFSETRHW